MNLRLSRYYAEIYFVLMTILFYQVVRFTWFFRKINLKTGLTYDFKPLKFTIVSLIVLFTIWLYKNSNLDVFSKNVLGLILVIYFIPSSIFFASVSITPIIYSAHLLLFYGLFFAFKIRYQIPIPTLNSKQSLFLLIGITILGLLPFLRYISHINLKNLILLEIYGTRFKFRELFDNYSSYTHSWFSRVIIPVIFVFALKYKLKLLAFLNFMVLVLLYLMGAVKSVILGSLLVVIFYFIPARKIYNYTVLGLIVLALVAIAAIPFFDPDYNTVAVLIFRRLMFLPNLLDYTYYDFFNANHLYWSNSFLEPFLEYTYNTTPPRVIGAHYFDRPDMAANNGIISDGFANAGILGVLANITLFCLFFSIIKNCNVDNRFFGIYFFFIYNIFTTTFSTVLVTHGGLLLILLSILILRRKLNPIAHR